MCILYHLLDSQASHTCGESCCICDVQSSNGWVVHSNKDTQKRISYTSNASPSFFQHGGSGHVIPTTRNWTLLDSGLLPSIHFAKLLRCTVSLFTFAICIFFQNMSDLLIPEESSINIPQHPAELGRRLRKHGADKEAIKIFVGKYDIWRAISFRLNSVISIEKS